jgi:hypothetical protein
MACLVSGAILAAGSVAVSAAMAASPMVRACPVCNLLRSAQAPASVEAVIRANLDVVSQISPDRSVIYNSSIFQNGFPGLISPPGGFWDGLSPLDGQTAELEKKMDFSFHPLPSSATSVCNPTGIVSDALWPGSAEGDAAAPTAWSRIYGQSCLEMKSLGSWS